MADFHTLEHAYFSLSRRLDPVGSSAEGLTTYDNRYGRFGEQEMRPELEKMVMLGRALKETKPSTPDEAIDRVVLLNSVQSSLYSYQADRPQVYNPDFWLAHLLEGLQLLTMESDRTPEQRALGLIGRLNDAPAFLKDAQNTIQNPPKLFVNTAIEISKSGRSLLQQVEQTGRLTPDHAEEITAGVRKCEQALSSFESDLNEWAKTDNQKFAIGKESFLFHLHHDHGLTDTLSDLWKFGMTLKQQCEAELTARAKKLGGTDDWKALLEKYREKHPERAQLVDAYRGQMEKAKAFLQQKRIVTIPKNPLVVQPTPAFRRVTTPFASYEEPATFSKKQIGIFSVTLPDKSLPDAKQNQLIRDHCIYEIPVTAVHEGYPGHHLQLSTMKTLPSETRKLISTPVSLEGWALYCEGLMAEQGFYEQPEEEFFVWFHLLWRACRVILDVGLHTQGLTFEQGVSYLMKNLMISKENATAEVRRYCTEPTTQLSYAVGRREILRLRKDFQSAKQGTSLLDFHDTFLKYGGLPVVYARKGMGLS